MKKFHDDRAKKYETTMANLNEMFAEEKQNLRDLLTDPEWADNIEGTKAEIAMLIRIQRDIFRLFGNAY